MPDAVFECGNPKCAYAIAVEGLNDIQLQVLRRWAKTCPQCQQRTKWQEKIPLINTKTIKSKTNGGSNDANLSKVTTKTASQKRKAARHDGRH